MIPLADVLVVAKESEDECEEPRDTIDGALIKQPSDF